MRFFVSALALVLLTASAQAQFGMDQKKKNQPVDSPEHKKAAEKAFQRAQQVIPNADVKADPWSGVRKKQ
jgi:hypothetical protein